MGFWKKPHSSEMPFSSQHLRGVLTSTGIIDDVNLDHLVEEVFPRLFLWKGTL